MLKGDIGGSVSNANVSLFLQLESVLSMPRQAGFSVGMQPFSIGRYMWMHNGEIGGFSALRLPLLNALRPEVAQKCPCFESDTAVAFAVFLNQVRRYCAKDEGLW